MNFGFADLLLVSPILALFVASIIPITIKVLRRNVEQPSIATLIQALCGVVCSLLLLVTISGSGATAFSNALVFDGVTTWMGAIALIAGAGSLALMHDNPATSGEQFSELVFLTLNSIVGMMVLVSAVDLLMVFIGLETMSLSLYLMIAMSHEQRLSKEAAFKYFILGSLASAIFLYGIALIFATCNTTYIPEIISKTEALVDSSRLFLFGCTLVILGFCFKVSIAPFHAWTPDVYQGAPTPHTAFMATAVKAVSFAAFLRIISTKVLVGSENLFDFLQWLAVATMLIGNLAAIMQSNLKRMLAYSSIAHSGYILVGVITTGISDRISFGASGVIFYLISYSIMTLGSFAIITLLEKTENTAVTVNDLAGLAKKRPGMAFCLTLFMLSLAGVPPTVGFFGKLYLFTSAIGEGLIWLAIWGVINSVISAYYYLRPIVMMYMRDGSVDEVPAALGPTRIAIVTAAVLVVVLGFVSGPLFSLVESAL
jgi:NADH-quinone oxidoreductase subunit N